jgi:hypothetical protein
MSSNNLVASLHIAFALQDIPERRNNFANSDGIWGIQFR